MARGNILNSLVSVIVPAYNAEAWIERCVESVCLQTYQNIELIVIDDGSTDKTGMLLDNLQVTKNIRVIHQQNSGVSHARNVGIDLAKGEYIFFLDSDDWIEPNAIHYLMQNAKMGIVPLIGYYNDYENKDPEQYLFDNIESKEQYTFEIFEKLFCNIDINYLWNKIFDKAVLNKYAIRFDENIALGEDLLFNLQYFLQMDEIKLIRKPLYHYSIWEKGSLSTKIYGNQLEIEEQLSRALLNFLETMKDKLHGKIGNALDFNIKLLMNNYIFYFDQGNGKRIDRYKAIRASMKTSVLQEMLELEVKHFKFSKFKAFLIQNRLFFIYYCFYKVRMRLKKG